ncbi:glycosyltransferase [Secundilactobacillus oryzae]|uniref:glycosyltransferase n=1 Tax=Secundilactobacillus oryzae TaxID=1202668 RepID=UPI0006D19552|nr:glycosyltransferase [Secundilactobacillus oryzae]
MHENPEIKVKTFGFKKPIEFPKLIEFLENPSKDELNKWYDSIDIFYVPSLYEGWGLPAMEAMARGCAVIGANTGCLKEFGKHLENCYKINNMTNQQELFQGLELLIKADDLRQKNF